MRAIALTLTGTQLDNAEMYINSFIKGEDVVTSVPLTYMNTDGTTKVKFVFIVRDSDDGGNTVSE